MNLVSVLCDAPGFRRAGRAWPAQSVVDMDDFSEAEQRAIYGEAQLEVRVLSAEEKNHPALARMDAGGRLQDVGGRAASGTSGRRAASGTKAEAGTPPGEGNDPGRAASGKRAARKRKAS